MMTERLESAPADCMNLRPTILTGLIHGSYLFALLEMSSSLFHTMKVWYIDIYFCVYTSDGATVALRNCILRSLKVTGKQKSSPALKKQTLEVKCICFHKSCCHLRAILKKTAIVMKSSLMGFQQCSPVLSVQVGLQGPYTGLLWFTTSSRFVVTSSSPMNLLRMSCSIIPSYDVIAEWKNRLSLEVQQWQVVDSKFFGTYCMTWLMTD